MNCVSTCRPSLNLFQRWSAPIFFLFVSSLASAQTPVIAHPLSIMHQLPHGEEPGWSGHGWFDLAANVSNIWNAPMTVRSKTSGKQLTYFMDYEQTTTTLDIGVALSPSWAFGVEALQISQDGGLMDNFIDGFHKTIRAKEFERSWYPSNEFHSTSTVDGVSVFDDEKRSGIGNYKLKLKNWLLKGKPTQHTSTGLAWSLQLKTALMNSRSRLSSGGQDVSFLIHWASSLFSDSSVNLTLGLTWLGENDAFREWPRRTQIYMVDGGFDLSLARNWGFILQSRAESPFMDEAGLSYEDSTNDHVLWLYNRMSTGWNSLVYWRVHHTLGFRFSPSDRQRWTLTMSEDYNEGDKDDFGDWGYCNNAPDVAFDLKWRWFF